MAHLSMNPEGHMVREGRTLAEIIANEEYLEPEKQPEVKEEKEEKKMKFLSFELDMKYPRTLRGFVRTLQIILLLVSFVCLIITSWGDGQGAYTFYCIALIFAALIGGFLFFTILAGSRSGQLCGLSWVKLELIYFVLFGFLVFIGACLAASNNSTGNPALNAGAAFGFLACITFAVYIFWTLKDYKNPPEDEENKDDESKEEKQNDEDPEKALDNAPKSGNTVSGTRMGSQRRRGSLIDPPQNANGDLRIDPPMDRDEHFRSKQSRRFTNEENRSLGGQISVISHNEMADPGIKHDQFYRRRRSGSDKDSAYSEGSMNERDRSLPTKIRRTASMREDRARASVKNKRHHMGDRRMYNSPERRPRQLSAQELMNEDSPKRKSVPSWLKAALEDDDPEILRLSSTMPAVRRKNEFPLLHTSDEESVAYPSVSQTLGNQDPLWNHRHPRRAYRENPHHIRRGHNHMKHGRNNNFHGPHHRGGKRHVHGHRQLQGHGKGHGHGHGQNRGQHRHMDRHGRIGPGHQRVRPNVAHGRVRPQDNEFLRRMVENDTLVDRRENAARLAETKRVRQKLHESPSGLHFPERSRWDDNDINIPERGVTKAMIENYLDSA